MATPAQIQANQQNAQRSTGPRTAESKARSAANSMRHGFCSQSVLLPGGDPAEYQAMLDDLRDHFPCVDLTEDRLVREMADAEWRLRRCRVHQETLLTEACHEISAADPALDAAQVQVRALDRLLAKSNTLAVLMRYETKFERQYERAYRGWVAYQNVTRKNELRTVSEAPPNLLERFRAVANMNLPDEPNPGSPAAPSEPNPPARTPRNARCPCGSGAKYKRCCGRNAAPILS